MISEQIEFQISQYADGTLALADRPQIDALVKADPAAQAMLRQYEQLDAGLSQLKKMPALRWDRLAEHLSNAIDEDSSTSAVVGRIGFLQSRWRIAATILVAASAVLIARQALRINHVAVPATVAPASVTIITGPQAEVAAGPAVQDITVGPSPALAARDGEARYGEGVIGQGPAKVIIVGGLNPPANADSHVH